MASQNSSDRGPRPGDGLHLRPLNVEKGSKRFSATDSGPPRTATWRNNLTALSQRRNLLFVAYRHQIYVWEPAGSFQMLGSEPEMIITPVMKEIHGSGYISPNAPHAINNILVDDLGREEVLLLVTDSGNVCGYRVEAIFSALKRAGERKNKRPLDDSQVDPFFVEYVEASAWGLAIHKFARLIAVSANTGLVTVFAFALVNPTSQDDCSSSQQIEEEYDFTDYDQTWLDIRSNEQFSQLQRLMPDKHRTRNIKLTYTGHFSNIPSVSFYNSDLDPNGTWMVSTDIDNKLLVWKIWESLGPFNVYHFNETSFRSFPESLRNDSERGWTVLALDPRSFHLAKSTEKACGGQPVRRTKRGQAFLNITKLSNHVPDVSHVYSYFPPASRPQPDQPTLPDIFGADCRIDNRTRFPRFASNCGAESMVEDGPAMNESQHSSYSTSSESMRSARQSNWPSELADTLSHRAVDGSAREDENSDSRSTGMESGRNQQATGQDANGLHGDDALDRFGQGMDEIRRRHGHGPLTTAEFLQFALLEALGGDIPGAEEYFDDDLDYSDIEDADNVDDSDDEMEDTEGHSSDSDALSAAEVASYPISDPLFQLYFPILHFSQTDIRLLPHPLAPHASVMCGSPLRQTFTRPIVSLRACDRFNMVKYIPEHGIVIAASQKGRAAVIALTQSQQSGLSFRVDWIVPFESQEKFGDRPLVPLLGMAVSPMQGFEIPSDVPYIPRHGADSTDAVFRFRSLNHDRSNNTTFPHSSRDGNPGHPSTHEKQSPTFPFGPGLRLSAAARERQYPLTLPECHARATRAYKPDEPWRGWNPSRRYRLLLMYDDHSVMSYEFWYDWNTRERAGEDGMEEDEILII